MGSASTNSSWSVGATKSDVLVKELTRAQIVMYAGASGDYIPLHTDEVYAKEVAGYPSVFAHGMLTMGLAGVLLTDWFGDGTLRTFGGRFRNQVWPGDTLTGHAEIVAVTSVEENGATIEIVEATLDVVNQDGAVVFQATASAAPALS